ncbi:xylose isomerase [Erysipelothrix sp. HDW6C]|uniref:xylose isomerase n=1 Tax=Erysipelothrix sp. HDW6C TaxID=2714930 RepID=UPI00140C11B0|nr:xylose isomerase [Erysipelothrix sp. HDW6C]QIK70296.1 xylose isomerase [Erysipelothrix sp. HDW6C]
MEYFKGIEKIVYEGPKSSNDFAYRHYDADEIVLGKPMKEHLRFGLAYWHTMTNGGNDPFGDAVNERTWVENDPMVTAINRVDAFFELLEKLGVEYFCFHDVDIAPQGNSLEEFFENLDVITDLMKEKMAQTGIKLLWNTANLFTHPRFLNGGATSNNADVYAYSAAQVKKGLELSKKLGGQNYVFWGGREGYESLLNTDMNLELDNMARFFKMAIAYKKKIGHDVQFLIEPKPKEPTTHQYDFDAATSLAFLQKYDLQDDFKLNLEANHATLAGHTFEHEIAVANTYNALGSLDANQGHPLLGWDTDEFPTNLMDVTLAMVEVLDAGGIAPGGINFDAKVRRTSFAMDDLVLAHIAGMDTFARGFKAAIKLKEDKFFTNLKEERYASFKSGIGKEIIDGTTDLESLAAYAMEHQDITNKSGHIEIVKSKLNDYIY